jgi:phage terminase small subunit
VKLTAEQRTALDALPEKRRAFVVAYARQGFTNATEAARKAGYKSPIVEGSRLLSDANVKAAIEAFRRPDEAKTLRTIEQLQARWAEWADDDGCQLKDRLKATELLGKSIGAFVERREVKHEGVSVVGVVFPSVEAARRVAKGESE